MKYILILFMAIVMTACSEDTGVSPVTEFVEVHDTVFVDNSVVRYDTVSNMVVKTDTVILKDYIRDTTILDRIIKDTVITVRYVNDTVTVKDTVIVDKIVKDTVEVVRVVNDTTVVRDTISIIDTIAVHDTMRIHSVMEVEKVVHDTIYVEVSSSSSLEASSSSESSSSSEDESSSSFNELDTLTTFSVGEKIYTFYAFNSLMHYFEEHPQHRDMTHLCESLGAVNASRDDLALIRKSMNYISGFNDPDSKFIGRNAYSYYRYTLMCTYDEDYKARRCYSKNDGPLTLQKESKFLDDGLEVSYVEGVNTPYYPFYVCRFK